MNNVLVLLYHRVGEVENDIFDISVSSENFDKQMRYLSENYYVTKFDNDWSQIEKDAIVITFDDGYEDNYINAVPILEKYSIPATFFVSTSNIGSSREYWWDEIIDNCIAENGKNSFRLKDDIFEYTWDTSNYASRIEMGLSIRQLLRREASGSIRDYWLKQLQDWSGRSDIGNAKNYSMNEEQIRIIAEKSLFTIGGHTVTHRSLGALNYKEQYKECKESIDMLKHIIGRQVDVFSYPFGGANDYNSETITIMKKLGVKKAATTKQEVYRNGNLFEIPRVAVKNIGLEEFCVLLSSFGDQL